MRLHEHIWGESRAVDAVWSQVCGLAPDAAEHRLLSVWQFYVDESIGEDIFVVGGFVSEAARWAAFAKD